MEGIRKDLEPLVDIQMYSPKNPHKHLPLLTYDCRYQSVNDTSQIKLDIFYGDREDIPTKTIDGDFETMGFKIDFPVKIYDHASLIVDKMTTLAFNTIGLPEHRRHDVPKQIYDVASLLKSFHGVLPIYEMAGLLKRISHTESGYCQEEYSFEDILTDLVIFPDLLVDENLKLESQSQGHLGTFRNNLLVSGYSNTDYVTDILLIKLTAKLIRHAAGESLESSEIWNKKMDKVLATLQDASNSKKDKIWRKAIARKYEGREKELVNRLPNQQMYLYDCIREA